MNWKLQFYWIELSLRDRLGSFIEFSIRNGKEEKVLKVAEGGRHRSLQSDRENNNR